MSRLVIIMLLLVATNAAYAAVPLGPYLGVITGMSSDNVDDTLRTTQRTVERRSTTTYGPVAGAIAGYSGINSGIYSAIEFGAGYNLSSGDSNTPSELHIDFGPYANVSALIGAPLGGKSVLYAKGGWQWQNVEFKGTTVDSFSDSAWVQGPVVGGGFMREVIDNVIVRVEYTHAFYAKYDTTRDNLLQHTFEPSSNRLSFSASYAF
ncbi:MAG: porin family protein [Nitrococcus sp.]|nr:porin family protein [Nitrococcus sp.]